MICISTVRAFDFSTGPAGISPTVDPKVQDLGDGCESGTISAEKVGQEWLHMASKSAKL